MRMRKNGLGRLVSRRAAMVRRTEVSLRDGFNWDSVHVEDGKASVHAHQHSIIGIHVRKGIGGLAKEAACPVRRIWG